MAGVSIRIEFLIRQVPSGNCYFVTVAVLAFRFKVIRIAATKKPKRTLLQKFHNSNNASF